ncbi:Transcriptional regulator MntR [bioreactor metagenome]|uniref:Transcriptional regulator MntR n=1 Tax=bioreactor metagenome TaxID=1076179 RepID=A0A645I0D5_9ZZZZ
MKLHESGENYLETILMLKQEKGYVRSIDVANAMGFSKPSVSRAVGILKSEGFIVVEKDGNLELTDAGQKRAEKVYERHLLLTDLLHNFLGVSEETAEEDACRIEHIISQETFEKIKEFTKKEK